SGGAEGMQQVLVPSLPNDLWNQYRYASAACRGLQLPDQLEQGHVHCAILGLQSDQARRTQLRGPRRRLYILEPSRLQSAVVLLAVWSLQLRQVYSQNIGRDAQRKAQRLVRQLVPA